MSVATTNTPASAAGTSSGTQPGTRPGTKQMPFHRKVTYALTDFSGNLLYCIISGYALYYFTEVYGISMAAAGVILLVARIFDSFDAPVWGIIIDHTRSRWGQSRPWFLWMAVPFALAVWLVFTAPPFTDPTAKAIYAGVIYVVAGICFTGINAPITSVLPNLTSDVDERTVANTFRMIGGNVGNFFAVTFILPLATAFGGGDSTSKLGWSLAVGAYCVIGLACLIVAFLDMREQAIHRAKSISIKDSVRALKGNWPWLLLFVANTLFWVGMSARNSMVPYYAQYNMGDKTMTAVLNGFSIIQVLGMASVPFLVKALGKTGSTMLGFVVGIVGQAAITFTAALGGAPLIVSWCVACIGAGIACSLFFEMIGDTVDYGEWKTGIRAAGFLTAIGSAFCIKLGSGLGGFVPSMIMNAGGYVADHAQSASSLASISFSFVWVPAIAYALAIIPMLFYIKYEKHEPAVIADLNARAATAADAD
ncbi:MFS transporter [Bifidobacterium platyrrhinorum]|uniref:MFS transporter n=1 Tax=Bifidobacterium platyrrhinorum TaxID=2661628 RepID=A0A6L9SY53_9BIFI|nr:MFS transporter [Bifidobacterium platyrrhinorum]NEG56051.1 MFS transporter [Bifidobacterium platyrrhinorum]